MSRELHPDALPIKERLFFNTLERIAKALEEHNEINKKGWELVKRQHDHYLVLNPLPTASSEIQPERKSEDAAEEVIWVCNCNHPEETHGSAGCYVKIDGSYCSFMITSDKTDSDLINSLSTFPKEKE